MAIQRLHMYAGETRLINFDFSGKTTSGVTLTSPVTTVSPSGLNLGTPSVTGQIVQVAASSGTDATTYRVKCQASSSNGEVLIMYADVCLDARV